MSQSLKLAGRNLAVLFVVAMLVGGGSLFAQRPEFAADHYFVGFSGQITANDRTALVRLGAALGKSFAEINVLEVVVRNPAVLAAIQRNANVSFLEPVPMQYPLDLGTSQLTPSLSNGLYGLITTKATAVHTRGVTGLGVNVGVADTGIDFTHPDIAPNYKGGIDTVGRGDNDPFWNNDPNETHGTHVAGTILAASNSVGVLGAAYQANLYHARVLGPEGGTAVSVMEGVRALVEMFDCKVVNLSLGNTRSSRTEALFYRRIRDQGVVIVAATGNDGVPVVSFPAAYPTNIAVGAVDVNNLIASFSNTGPEVDIVAPGVTVLSSVPLNMGSEASVSSNATPYTAFGIQFAGTTTGITQNLVNCGFGAPGECPSTVSGNIALIQRGNITFGEKAANAKAQGAVAAIIYNNAAGELSGFTLGSPTPPGGGTWIPVVGVSQASGAALLGRIGQSATVVNMVTSWDHFSGTSMATPHVTGVVALIWSANPALTNNAVENILLRTATDLGTPGFDSIFGNGLVNADAAVAQTGH